MTYFADFELCKYHNGALDADEWSVPLRAIGWLEHPQPFNKGEVSAECLLKLKTMVEEAREAFPHYYFRGMMRCTICLDLGEPSPWSVWSQENLLVPGNSVVYAAPGGIVHYIESHSYLPPSEFVEAVLHCSDLKSDEYHKQLRTANNGNEPPFESYEANLLRSRKMFDRFK